MKPQHLYLISAACFLLGFGLILFGGPMDALDPQSIEPSAISHQPSADPQSISPSAISAVSAVNNPQSAASLPGCLVASPSFDSWYQSPAAASVQAYDRRSAYCAFSAGYQAAQANGSNKTIIPWLEVPVPTADAGGYPGAEPGMRAIDHALAGLRHWATVTDTALITTKVDAIDYLYPALPPSVIGGFKTSSVLPGVDPYDPAAWDFADLAAWQRIAECAERIAQFTGQRIVLLENEGALRRYHSGEESISVARLTLALAPVRETGLRIWWNLPSVQADTEAFPDCRRRTAELTAAIAAAVPDSVFFGGYAMRPGRRADPDEQDRRAEMLAIVGPDRLLDRLLLTAGEEPRRYTVAAAIVEAWALPRGPVIVYPGVKDWIPTGEQLAALVDKER